MPKKNMLVLLPVFWPKMPPLGIFSLGSYTAQQGVPIEILDLNNYFYHRAAPELKKEWLISCHASLEDNILSHIETHHTRDWENISKKMAVCDNIGFSVYKSNFKTTLEVARRLKEINKKIKIVFGGPEITRQYFKTVKSFDPTFSSVCDCAVVGEGEKPFVMCLNEKISSPLVLFQELPDLKELPFPKYKDVDFSFYSEKNAVSLMFSRGCVRSCRFCSERLLYQTFRTREIKNLMEEISYHRARGIEYFIFHDSMFNANLKKLNDFCDEVIRNFGSLNWEAQMAVRTDMDAALFEKISKSGCYNLFIGLESGSDKTLKSMNKGFKSQDALMFFDKMKKTGLHYGVSLIVGFPGETDEDFRESLDFICYNRTLIPKVEQINPFIYYEGTQLIQEGIKEESLKRMEMAVAAFKKSGIKYTNAFIGNLLEK